MLKRLFSIIALVGAVVVPLSASAANYVIQRGDTLTSIAREFGVSIGSIAEQNNIANVNKIYAGDTLTIGDKQASEGNDGLLGGPGGSYTPVTGYQSRLSTYVSASATTIPVASTKDKAGNQIVLTDISSSSTAKVYLSVATGTSKEEIIVCTGLTAASWTGCSRGLSFQGGSMTASTTLAYTHNAGTSIIITDVGQFFTEFVSINGNQTIYDRKTFYAFPIVTSTTALPTLGSELANKYYVDNVGAGGFTASNVSTTRGLSVDGSAPERVGINVSTTRGLAFDNNGTANRPLMVTVSSTGGIGFASDGSLQFDPTQNINFTGALTFSGNVTSTGSSRITQTPTISADVVNLGYLNNTLTSFVATGTAASTIAVGKALYATVTSTINPTDTAGTSSTFYFIGFANSAASATGQVSYTRPGGINCQQSGLSPGAYYYLNGANGAIATTAASIYSARVGLALSATCIQVTQPKYKQTGSVSTGTAANGSTFRIATGFYPALVTATAANPGSTFYSVTTDADNGVLGGAVDGTNRNTGTPSIYFEDEGGSCYWRGLMSKDRYGMTITNDNYTGAGCGTMTNTDIYWSISNE